MRTNQLSPWKRFVGLLELEKKDIIQIGKFAIFEGVVALSLPLGIQAIINLLQGAQLSISWIVLIVLVTIGVAFTGILKLMQIRIIETIQQRIFTRASFDLSYRFPKINMSELQDYDLPELANRFFDTLTIQKGLSKILIDVPSAFLQIMFALGLLSFYHPFFIVFGLFLLLLIFILFKYTAQKGLETSLEVSKNKYKVANWIQEVSRAVISFKLSGKTNLAMDKSDIIIDEYLKSRESHFKIMIFQFSQLIGFKVLVTAGLLVIGGFLVLDQRMNIGQFVAAEIIIIIVITSVEKLILGLDSFYDVLTSIEKLGQVVDKSIEPQTGELLNPDADLTIELKDVSYGVEGENETILSDISLILNPTDRILIQGKSGSGKSSLLRLISRVTIPTSGFIYVNNLSIDGILVSDYRANLGMALLDETPFEGTIRENVTFGNTAISDESIYETFYNVGLTKFLKHQPKGLNTVLKPRGKQLTNTIGKKIVLARALLKQPKVLILEEPLDHFHNDVEDKIINFLTDPSQPWSLIVVSNNDNWKQKCNKQITLKRGKIINQI